MITCLVHTSQHNPLVGRFSRGDITTTHEVIYIILFHVILILYLTWSHSHPWWFFLLLRTSLVRIYRREFLIKSNNFLKEESLKFFGERFLTKNSHYGCSSSHQVWVILYYCRIYGFLISHECFICNSCTMITNLSLFIFLHWLIVVYHYCTKNMFNCMKYIMIWIWLSVYRRLLFY